MSSASTPGLGTPAPPPEPPATPKKRVGFSLEPWILLGPSGIWLFVLMVLPIVFIFSLSLTPGVDFGDIVNPSSLKNYQRVFQAIPLRALGRSVGFAGGCTLICLVLGFPVAYWIALAAPKRWRNLMLLSFVLPLWTSSLLRTYAWLAILRRTGVLNTVLDAVGIPPIEILYTAPAVLVGMSYSYLPYMVLILYASLEKLDTRLLEASADLGAGPFETFWKITIPQTIPGIVAGCALVGITSLGDFIDPALLGGPNNLTIAGLIYKQFISRAPDWSFGSALSMVLILAVSVAIAILIRFGEAEPKR